MKNSIFTELEDRYQIATEPIGHGLYHVHVKVSNNGDYETYRNPLNFDKAIRLAENLRVSLDLPIGSVYLACSYEDDDHRKISNEARSIVDMYVENKLPTKAVTI